MIKKYWIAGLIAAGISLLGTLGQTEAQETPEETVINVLDFGADGSDTEDDKAAFQQALRTATESETPIRVRVPAGTYYIEGGGVAIFSNTTIEADENAHIVSTGHYLGPMFYGAHLNDDGQECYGEACTHGGHTQTQNVTIIGGIWDRGDLEGIDNSCVLSFRHADYITLEGLTCRNATNHHINISGSADVMITGCTIENSIRNSSADSSYWSGWEIIGDPRRYDFIEAIHLDICNETGEDSDRAKPFDNAAATRVTVDHCTFRNVFCGVGNHHEAPGEHPTDVTVTNNLCEGVRAYLLYTYDFDDFVLENNILEGCGALCTIQSSTGVIRGNRYLPTPAEQKGDAEDKNAIYIHDDSTVEIRDNQINGANLAAIRIMGNSSLTAENNEVHDADWFGFYVTDSQCILRGNTVYETGNERQAFRAERCQGAVIDGNTVVSSANHGIAINTCDGASITDNTVSGTMGHGIHISTSQNVRVSGNQVTKAGGYGLLIEGTSETATASAYIFNNAFSSSGSYDLRIGRYAKNCVLAANVLAHEKVSYDKTATYTVQSRVFTDVMDRGKYYYKPVYWAADKNITKGYDDGTFGYDLECTRAHIVTFLWRLAGKPAPKTQKNPFSDVAKNAYYYKAVLWAAEKGITKGYDDGTFRPDDTCLREHVVTFLYRYAGKPDIAADNPFNDVDAGAYYYKPVLWASGKGIAKGYTSGEHAGGFAPQDPCLREHVVTFLYRFAK